MEAIHELVRTLTKGEKQFLRQFALLRGDKDWKYLQIFDIIEKMKTYDEKKVKEKIKDPVLRKNFAVHKHYLYKMILRSLRVQYDEADVTNSLCSRIMEANILTGRELYENAGSLLSKANEMSEKYQRPSLAHEIVSQQLRPNLEKTLYEELYQKQESYIEQLQLFMFFEKAYDEFLYYLRKGDTDSLEKLTELVHRPEFDDAYLAIPVRCLGWKYQIKSRYYFEKKDMETSAYYSGLNVSLLEKNMHLVRQNPKPYISTLYTHALRMGMSGKEEEFLKTLNTLKNIRSQLSPFHKRSYGAKIGAFAVNLELWHYVTQGKYRQGAEKLDLLLADFKECEPGTAPELRLIVYYLGSLVCFYTGRYKNCRKHLLHCLQDEDYKELRIDVHIFSHLYRALSFLEEQDETGLATSLKELKHKIKISGYHSEVIDLMTEFFNNDPLSLSRKELLKGIRTLHHKIMAVTNDNPIEKNIFASAYLNSWFELHKAV